MKQFLLKINSLDRIHQWEERDSVIMESVSQHSFKVSAIAVYLLNEITSSVAFKVQCNDRCRFSDFKYRCLSYAVLHDFDEAIIGRDISHVVKYNSFNGDEIRHALDKFVEHNLTEKFGFVSEQPDKSVKCFVKLCDWIALLTFIQRNKDMGVKTFDSEQVYCYDNIEKKREEVIKMLKEEFGIDYEFKFRIDGKED